MIRSCTPCVGWLAYWPKFYSKCCLLAWLASVTASRMKLGLRPLVQVGTLRTVRSKTALSFHLGWMNRIHLLSNASAFSKRSFLHRQNWPFWMRCRRTCQGRISTRGICSRRFHWPSCKFWRVSDHQDRTFRECPALVRSHLLLQSYMQIEQVSEEFYGTIWADYLQDDSLVNESRMLLGSTEHVDHVFHWHIC